MKIILKIAFVAIFIPIQSYTNIADDIKYAIQKSKPDLFKKSLENQTLTDEQKKLCLKFAYQISEIRENKMNINMFKPKKRIDPSGPFYRILGLLGIVSSGAGFVFLLNRMIEANNVGAIITDLACMVIFEWGSNIYFKKIIRAWSKIESTIL